MISDFYLLFFEESKETVREFKVVASRSDPHFDPEGGSNAPESCLPTAI